MSPVVDYITVDEFFNHFNIRLLTLLFQIYDVTNHYCIFLCLIPTRIWPKNAKPRRRFTTCLYITASNYTAVVGIYICFF
jgi:hypothetical protein